MRYIHPAAWMGLLLNIGLAYILFSALMNIEVASLPEQERAIMESLLAAVGELRPFYYGLLLVQGIAIGLISARLTFGLWIAFAAAFFMLPGSLVYLIGCTLSHYRVKYAAYETAPPDYAGALYIFPSFAVKRARVFAGVCLALFAVFMLTGLLDVSLVFLGMGAVGVYCSSRAGKFHPLSIHEDYFSLTPALFAGRLLIPYESVQLATLFDNEVIQFQIETPQGVRVLGWPLRSVDVRARRDALEELGAALAAHHVPLQ